MLNLLIQVPEELHEDIMSDNCSLRDVQLVLKIMKNGIALPKGHGRLGDLDALELEMENGIKAGLQLEGYEKYQNLNDMDDCLECVKFAPTIIEADEEEV